SAIWRKTQHPSRRSHLSQPLSEAAYLQERFPDCFVADVCLSPMTNSGAPWQYTALWQSHASIDPALDMQRLPCMDGTKHLDRCRALASLGYRPAAIAISCREEKLLSAASVWHRARVTDEALEALAKRQANAALILLRFGQEECVWPLLRHNPDPR